jgi:hypothetical protein
MKSCSAMSRFFASFGHITTVLPTVKDVSTMPFALPFAISLAFNAASETLAAFANPMIAHGVLACTDALQL